MVIQKSEWANFPVQVYAFMNRLFYFSDISKTFNLDTGLRAAGRLLCAVGWTTPEEILADKAGALFTRADIGPRWPLSCFSWRAISCSALVAAFSSQSSGDRAFEILNGPSRS